MSTFWHRLSAPTLRTKVFFIFAFFAAFGLMPRQAIAVDSAQITFPSASIDVYGQRTINVTIKNISNVTWDEGTVTPVVTHTGHIFTGCWLPATPPEGYTYPPYGGVLPGYEYHGRTNECGAGSVYRVTKALRTDSLGPIPQALNPGDSVTVPILVLFLLPSNGSADHPNHSPLVTLTLMDQTQTSLGSASAATKAVTYSGVLSITPSAPTSFPEVPIPLTATVTYIGQTGLLMNSSCSATQTRPGTIGMSLFFPSSSTTVAYSLPASLPINPGQTTTSSLSIPAPTVAGPYQLKSTTVTYDNFSGCNGLLAVGLSIGGSPVSTDTVLQLTVNPVPVIAAPVVRVGWNATSAITWPTSVTHSAENTNCGTKSTQAFTGTSGICTYTLPGDYTVKGNYIAKDGKLASTKPVTVSVAPLIPSTGVMKLTVNGQGEPDNATTISRYRTPAALAIDLALDMPNGIGIIDPIDISSAELQVVQGGVITATTRLTAGTDPLHLIASQTLATGETTLQLNAKTLSGTPISLSRTLTLNQIPVILTGSAPQQAGLDLVATDVAFPGGQPITPTNIDCGTTNAQVISATSVTCRYTKAGAYSIVGSFMPTGESGATPVLTQPLPFTVAGLPPANVALGVGVGEVILTTSPINLYSAPAIVLANVTMTRNASQIGVLDPINPDKIKLTFTPIGSSPTDLKPAQRSPLTFSAPLSIPTPGNYRLHLEAMTLLDVPVVADLPFSVTITPVLLTLSPLRNDQRGVALDVTWPDDLSGSVQCGLKSNSFDAHTGVCSYSAPGTYIVKAAFRDPLTRALVKLVDTSINIPAVAPSSVVFTLTTLNGTLLPVQTPPASVVTISAPTAYPLNFVATFSPAAPDSSVGIVIPFDPSRSTVTAVPLAGGDPEVTKLKPVLDSKALQAVGQIRTILANPTDPSMWASRILLTAYTAAGDSFNSEILLQGPIGNPGVASTIQLEVERTAPRLPYAPATYRYRVKRAITPTLKEPLTTAWTLQDAEGKTIESATASRYMTTLPSAGTYTLKLRISGPFSGSQEWTETLIAPPLPAPGVPVLITKAPQYNRPPATYRFMLAPQKFVDPRERAGIPTWSVDGGPPKAGLQALPTFTESGEHTVSAELTTSYNRVITAETSVTVNENQPPTATVDCSKSRFSIRLKKYILVCQSASKDPDGRLTQIKWVIPELNFERLDATSIILERPDPITATVELHVTDNSQAKSVITTLIVPSIFTAQ